VRRAFFSRYIAASTRVIRPGGGVVRLELDDAGAEVEAPTAQRGS
jgi:hypothetical protein